MTDQRDQSRGSHDRPSSPAARRTTARRTPERGGSPADGSPGSSSCTRPRRGSLAVHHRARVRGPRARSPNRRRCPRPHARPGVHRALAAPFPDPGFAKFGSTYFLYRTAAHFDVSNSASPDGGYTVPEPSMPALPGWVGPAPSGSRHLWAPDVFSVDEGERDLYVMYFTGYYPGTAARPCGANCIGVATSAAPPHDSWRGHIRSAQRRRSTRRSIRRCI